MKEPLDILIDFNPYDLAYKYISYKDSRTITKDEIDNDIQYQALYFSRLFNILDLNDKRLVNAKFKLFGKVNNAHLGYGMITLGEDSHLYTVYKQDPIKVSHHKYYIANFLKLLFSSINIEYSKARNEKKIKGVIVAAFFRYLSTSQTNLARGKEERVIDYCNRINENFNLPLHSRIETDFGRNENRIESIKLHILPLINDIELKEVLERYFNEI